MELRLLDFNDLRGVALIRDKLELSAAFLIPYLLQLALSADLKVVLLLVQDSSSHYQQALRKLNVSASAAGGLKSVIQQLTHHCQDTNATPTKGTCVIVDSLTAVHGLSTSRQEWQGFLHYCQALASVTKGQYACIMIAHEDVEDDAHWINWLRHAAQVEIEVKALESGASPDVTGQVVVTNRRAPLPASMGPNGRQPLERPRKMYVKLGAGNVRFFQ